MARPRLTVERPRCPAGHVGDVLLAGHRVWKDGIFARPRFLCVSREGGRHTFSLPRRQPTRRHPHGDACPICDAHVGRTGGPLTAVDFRFSATEIAALLIRLGRGASLRAAGQAARRDAQRRAVDGAASREADLAVDYLDAFGATIEAAVNPAIWPRILILDAQPLGLRVGGDEPARSPFRAGALLMAAGSRQPGAPARCWRIGLSGDETAASWFDFLGELPGTPEWVVCDRASAIANAAKERWPSVTIYACEYHLRQNLEAVAHADGLALDPDIARAIRRAQSSSADWEALAELAAAREAHHLRAWLDRHDDLLHGQLEARRIHPGYPRGNGVAESLLAQVVACLEARRGNFRNARRLRLLLALMCAELAGEADAARYARLIKEAIEATRGRPRIAWTAHQDPRASADSLSALLIAARERTAAVVHTRDLAADKARSLRRIVAAANVARAAADLPPLEATVSPGRRTPSVKVTGRLLSDFPAIDNEWATDLNLIDKHTVRAGSGRVVSWRCAEGHVWRAAVVQRTVRQTRCGRCVRPRASATIAERWPVLLDEWDASANRPIIPEHTLSTMRRAVWWRCLANRDHPSYRLSPTRRGAVDIGCPICRRERRERRHRRRTVDESSAPSLGPRSHGAMPKA